MMHAVLYDHVTIVTATRGRISNSIRRILRRTEPSSAWYRGSRDDRPMTGDGVRLTATVCWLMTGCACHFGRLMTGVRVISMTVGSLVFMMTV